MLSHRSSLTRVVLMIIVALLAACKPESTSFEAGRDQTPLSESTSITSATVEATAPQAHRWQAAPVLAELYTGPGYTSWAYAWSTMPDFVLYSDGRVLVSRYDYTPPPEEELLRTVWEARLTPHEMCSVLSRIETYGFFDFNPNEYRPPGITDHGTTHITVKAWRSREASAYALGYAVYSKDRLDSFVPEALAKTYAFLNEYLPPDVQPYQPEHIAVLIEPLRSTEPVPLWPLSSPKLADIAARLQAGDEYIDVVLEGDQARNVYQLFDGRVTRKFFDNGRSYQVTIRPLLPLETWEMNGGAIQSFAFPNTPMTELACDPGTSLVEVPTPLPTLTPAPIAIEPTVSPTPVPSWAIAAPLRHIGALGKRDLLGQLDSPSAVVVNSQHEIVVADTLKYRLHWFTVDGRPLRAMPLYGPNGDIAPEALVMRPDGSFLVAELDPRVYEFAADGQWRKTLQGWPRPPEFAHDMVGSFIKSIAEGPDGAVYIAETRGKRVIIMNPDNTVREIWTGPDAQPFSDIMDIATDSLGNLYVTSDEQNRVVKRTPQGQVIEFAIRSPSQIAVLADSSFYVESYDGISRYDAAGLLIATWSSKDLLDAADLAAAPDGPLVILEYDHSDTNMVLHSYTPDGRLIANFGSTKAEPGQFQSHSSFSVSPLSDVWLIDTREDESSLNRKSFYLVHLDKNGDLLKSLDSIGDDKLICEETLVAALADQTVVVADPCVGTIRHVSADGQVLHHWGERGTAAGQFNRISAVVIAPDDQSLYVIDESNQRIDRFALDGKLLEEQRGDQLGVQVPIGLAIDSDGTFYLLDGATREVVMRSTHGHIQRWTLPNSDDNVNAIAIDAKRGRLYIGSREGYLYAFDRFGYYLGMKDSYDCGGNLVGIDSSGRVYASGGYYDIDICEPND